MAVKGFTDLGKGRKTLLVDHDPTSVATDAPKGSLIIDANGCMYRKVDDGATTSVIRVGHCKCNHAATSAPTVDDDLDLGYGVGSGWQDTTADKAYICLDPTADAAVWIEITQTSGGESYVDRGDPASVDFDHTGLTMDGAWHTLDLSGIIGAAGASRLCHIALSGASASAGRYILMRKKGNTNTRNRLALSAAVTNETFRQDGWVMLDASRHIEYLVSGAFTSIEIVVRGWMA